MVIYDYSFQLGANQGDSRRASNQIIVLHDTGNANNVGSNSALNEASYMRNNWQNAYTHAIAGWDKVYIVGEPGYVAYGAGSPANERSPFQIELARYADKTKALQAYSNWINAVRDYANKYGIPLTLDDSSGKGVKSHKWVSDNWWGDHQDPWGYLSTIEISKQKVANDLRNGVGNAVTQVPVVKTDNRGIVRIDYDPRYRVKLTDANGNYTGQEVKGGQLYKSFSFNRKGVQIGNNKQWLPYQYAKIIINYDPRYGVTAVDKNGKYIPESAKTLKGNTAWKAVDGYIKDGVSYFGVGRGWFVPAKYTK